MSPHWISLSPRPCDGSPASSTRCGFTLIELLVVLGVIALIAGIGIFATRPFQSQSAVNNGATLLQTWVTVAKQRALRDQRQSGIRFLEGDEIADNSGGNFKNLVTKCVFIQDQGDTSTSVGNGLHNSTTWNTNKKILSSTSPLPTIDVKNEQPTLEVNGGTLFVISSMTANSIMLTADFPYSIPLNPGARYRIFRTPTSPPASAGTTDAVSEEVMRMPRGAAINFSANVAFPKYNTAAPPFNILFGPNGSVVDPPGNKDIVLWVTGTQKGADGSVNPLQGQPSLIVINPRTGYVAGYQADVKTAGNPYTQVP